MKYSGVYHRLEWAFLLSPAWNSTTTANPNVSQEVKLRGKVDAMGVFAVSGGSATFERSRMFDTHRQLARIDDDDRGIAADAVLAKLSE